MLIQNSGIQSCSFLLISVEFGIRRGQLEQQNKKREKGLMETLQQLKNKKC